MSDFVAHFVFVGQEIRRWICKMSFAVQTQFAMPSLSTSWRYACAISLLSWQMLTIYTSLSQASKVSLGWCVLLRMNTPRCSYTGFTFYYQNLNLVYYNNISLVFQDNDGHFVYFCKYAGFAKSESWLHDRGSLVFCFSIKAFIFSPPVSLCTS